MRVDSYSFLSVRLLPFQVVFFLSTLTVFQMRVGSYSFLSGVAAFPNASWFVYSLDGCCLSKCELVRIHSSGRLLFPQMRVFIPGRLLPFQIYRVHYCIYCKLCVFIYFTSIYTLHVQGGRLLGQNHCGVMNSFTETILNRYGTLLKLTSSLLTHLLLMGFIPS